MILHLNFFVTLVILLIQSLFILRLSYELLLAINTSHLPVSKFLPRANNLKINGLRFHNLNSNINYTAKRNCDWSSICY